MVVTRKAPTTPMPPTSRTNSSQPTPRPGKEKAPQRDDPPSIEHAGPQFSDEAVFSDGSPSPKKSSSKSKSKGKAKKGAKEGKTRKRRARFVDLVARIFLLFFTIYTLSVCPSDTHLQSPVCRGLSEYRRLVLEPYVLPHIHNALAHPSIAPVVAKAKPAYTAVVRTATPIVNRTRIEWKARVVPQYRKYVIPQYRKHVAPQLAKANAFISPYISVISREYEKYITPGIVQTRKWARKSQPYVILAAARTYDAYTISKPYLARSSRELQRVPPLFVKYVARPLAKARRQFVDPHVARMLEKIRELSSGRPQPSEDAEGTISAPPYGSNEKTVAAEISLPPVPGPTDEAVKSATSLLSSTTSFEPITSSSAMASSSLIKSSASLESVITSAVTTASSSLHTASSALAEGVTEPFTSVLSEATDFASDALSSASSILADGSSVATDQASIVSSSASSISTSAASIVSSSMSVVSDEANIASSSASSILTAESDTVLPSTTPAAAVPSPTDSQQSEIDLDEFYAELGIDDTSSKDTPSVSVPPPHVETEEEKAERQRQRAVYMAEKRRDIESRHTKWEEKVANEVKVQRKALRKALVALRKTATAELKANAEIRSEIERLYSEAEKALRGTEAYFAKVRGEERAQAEKVGLWERVLGKVEEKFDERVKGVERIVGQWYGGWLAKEQEEVLRTSKAVEAIANEGQADIGMDYAWLDDVTTGDWQRYHGLLETYREFYETALTIQNGTHVSPPANPLSDALDDLSSELEDVVMGFQTRLRRIRREGERAFAGSVTGDAAEDAEGETEGAKDTPANADETADEVPDHRVSILPIVPVDEKDAVLEEPVFLGRGQDEVQDALKRAAMSSEEGAADDVADKILEEGEHAAAVQHEEL